MKKNLKHRKTVIKKNIIRVLAMLFISIIILTPSNCQNDFTFNYSTSIENNKIVIPAEKGGTFDYTVDWGDGETSYNHKGRAVHEYEHAGKYQVKISGVFPRKYEDEKYKKDEKKSMDPSSRFNEGMLNNVPESISINCGEWIGSDQLTDVNVLASGDDSPSELVNLPFTFEFDGDTYTSIYININGNISFNAPISTYSPSGFPLTTPMIAPLWQDVDTRCADCGYIDYGFIGNDAIVVSWNSVGYYDQQSDKVNTYQVILSNGNYSGIPGNVRFNYGIIEWTTGSASGGVDGFGGSGAVSGINAGGTDGLYLQSSYYDDSSVSDLNCTTVDFNVATSVVISPVCQDATITLVMNDNGTPNDSSDDFIADYILMANEIDNGSSAAAGIQSLSVSPNVFSSQDIGNTIEVTLTVVDNNGDSNTCTALVTVLGPDIDCTTPTTTTPSEIKVCDDFSGNQEGQYQMQNADDLIRTNASHTVSYYEDLALTILIDASVDYTVSDATVIYAVVNDDICYSETVEVAFEVSTIINSFDIIHTECALDNGMITMNTVGGSSPYEYSINGGLFASNPEFSDLSAGLHFMKSRDADGCLSSTLGVTVDSSDPLDVSTSTTTATCGESTGSVSLTLNAGTNPISIEGGIPVSFPTISTGLPAGNYDWDLEDADGCIFTASFTINAVDGLDITSTPSSTTCGLDNGSVAFSINQGSSPITYTENGTVVTSFDDLSAGNYIWDAEDVNGCTFQVNFSIDPSEELLTSINSITSTTCGLENGNIQIFQSSDINSTISDSNGPIQFPIFSVVLTSGGRQIDISSLPAGTYDWTIKLQDLSGCESTISFTIDDSDPITVSAIPTATICAMDNGSVTFSTITGTDPVMYSQNGQPVVMSDLAAGNYTWDTEDANGCMGQVSFTIDESDVLSVSPNITHTTCNLDNGAISMTVNTGTLPVSYSNNGILVTDFTGLEAGDYSWEAEDAIGCTFLVDFTIDPSIEATFNTTPTNTFCDGNNGSVVATMTSGTGFLSYTLNGVVNNTGIYNNLAPGTYTMTAVDSEFCPASSIFTINGSAPLQISTVVTPTICNEDNGNITATLDSGTSPVNYSITGQGTNTTGIFSDLGPGTYTLNAVDAVGCEATETFTIAPSDPLDINTVIVHTTCELDNGSVSATLMSGTTPVTFTIAGQGSNTTGQFIDLAPGTYTMNAVDANGCQASVIFNIKDSTLPLFDMQVVRSSCGDINGSIQLTPDLNTGRAPYEFNIGTGWTTDYTFDNLESNDYTVSIRDADGCMTSQETTILDSEQLVIINHIDHADCNNLSGVITLITLQGTGPFSYSISNEYVDRQNDNGIFAYLEAGQYTATVIGTDGCVVIQKLIVENDPGVNLNLELNHPACGETDGSILFKLGKSGTAPYKVYLDGSLMEDSLYNDYSISDMANGDYKIEVIDYYGCSDYAEITINDGNSIVEDLVINHIGCEGELGSVSTIIGDPGDYTFTLGGKTNTDGSFTELEAGIYAYTATDSMGCDFTKKIEILDASFTDVRVLIINDDCEDLSNIKIIPENGNGPYRYFVNGKQYFENGAYDLPSGIYKVEVIDANGCSNIQEIEIEGESKLTYSILKCRKSKFGQPGFLVVQATGGEGPYRYKLDEYTSKKGLFVNLYKDIYTLTITDSRGCSRTFEVNLCEDDTFNKSLPSLRSIDEFSNVSIYPNPGDNILNIDHGSTLEESKIKIYSSTGQLIKQISINPASDITKINTQEWSKGIYFIKIGSTRMIKWFKV